MKGKGKLTWLSRLLILLGLILLLWVLKAPAQTPPPDETLTGTLEVYQLCDLKGGTAAEDHWLNVGGKRHHVHYRHPTKLRHLHGEKIRVKARRTGAAEILADEPEVLAEAVPLVSGARRTVVFSLILNGVAGASPAAIRSVMDVHTNNDLQWSRGLLSDTATVIGPYQITVSMSTCAYTSIQQAADAAATAAGVDLTQFTGKLYSFPQSGVCPWAGLGTVGGAPTQSWVNGTFFAQVVDHELGHGLGLLHSHGYGSEYGDTACAMGNSCDCIFNPFQSERLGWTTSRTVAVGEYNLSSYLVSGDSLHFGNLWVSFKPTGQASPIVNVRYGILSDRNSSNLLASLYQFSPAYTDPATGAKVTLVSATTTTARVRLEMGTATSPTVAPPIVTQTKIGAAATRTPTSALPDLVIDSLKVPGDTVAAGSTITVTDTTKNRGPAPANASTIAYYLSRTQSFDGMIQRLGERPVSDLAPGAVSSATVALKLPDGLAPGRYHVLAVADDKQVVAERNENNNVASRSIDVK